jgi:hypothetical protein
MSVIFLTKREVFYIGVSRKQTSAARLQGTADKAAVPPRGLGKFPNKPGHQSCRFIGYDCMTPCLLLLFRIRNKPRYTEKSFISKH